MHIEHDGVRRNLDHLAPAAQEIMRLTAASYIDAGMRPPSLSVIVAGQDVTKRPDLWPATERDYRGPGRLELLE
jgi:hypothetical protein